MIVRKEKASILFSLNYDSPKLSTNLHTVRIRLGLDLTWTFTISVQVKREERNIHLYVKFVTQKNHKLFMYDGRTLDSHVLFILKCRKTL